MGNAGRISGSRINNGGNGFKLAVKMSKYEADQNLLPIFFLNRRRLSDR